MRPNPVAPWELRIGILRVYYEIEAAETVVRILAVGVKEREQCESVGRLSSYEKRGDG